MTILYSSKYWLQWCRGVHDDKITDFQTKYNLNMKSHIDQTIHKLSAACYAFWSMFHISNIGTFQSTYFATLDEERCGGYLFDSKNVFTLYKATIRTLFGAKPRN
jgi:hypothetical protein